MGRWTGAAALGLALALLVAACGDGGDGITIKHRTPDGAVVNWGDAQGGDPKGVVILLPGGGWQRPSRIAFSNYERQALGLQAAGISTATVRYDSGAQAVGQVEDVYDEAKKRFPGVPICVSGGSAGGHLALLLAAHKPEVACVVESAGPTDLTTLAEQGSQQSYDLAVDAFGEDRLARFSPVNVADRIKAPVLMVYAETDRVVPIQQGEELARQLPNAEFIKLPAGPAPWLHPGGVSAEAFMNANQAQVAFLEQALAGAS